MIVRPVTVEELPSVVHLGTVFFAEANLPGGFAPEVFIRSWSKFIRTGIGTFLGAFEGDKFVGGLGAILAPDINNGHLTAVECFWYLLPEHRGGGLRLLRAYEKWAVECGARRAGMIHLHSLNPETMATLYERLGYRKIETNYVKDL